MQQTELLTLFAKFITRCTYTSKHVIVLAAAVCKAVLQKYNYGEARAKTIFGANYN
jgi:hypothetical protein